VAAVNKAPIGITAAITWIPPTVVGIYIIFFAKYVEYGKWWPSTKERKIVLGLSSILFMPAVWLFVFLHNGTFDKERQKIETEMRADPVRWLRLSLDEIETVKQHDKINRMYDRIISRDDPSLETSEEEFEQNRAELTDMLNALIGDPGTTNSDRRIAGQMLDNVNRAE
jgi:hypothetical protein